MTDKHFSEIGKKGGKIGGRRNTVAQNLARAQNARKARQKRWKGLKTFKTFKPF